MAGSKTVPLTWGIGGPVIGTATIDENGLAMGEIEDPKVIAKLFGDQNVNLSVYSQEDIDIKKINPDDVVEIAIPDLLKDSIARVRANSGYDRNTQRAQDIRTIVEEVEGKTDGS